MSLRQLFLAGAEDSEILSFVLAATEGHLEAARQTEIRVKAASAMVEPISAEVALKRVRIAAMKPAVNSLNPAQLQQYIPLVLHVSDIVVTKLQDESFWQSDAAIAAVADVVRQFAFDRLNITLRAPQRDEASECWREGFELSVDRGLHRVIGIAGFADRLGWPVGRVRRALATGSLFEVESGGEVGVPLFLADATLNLTQMRIVCRLLGGLSSASKLHFFTSPKGSLGGCTPIEAIAQRRFAAVKVAALGFKER